MEALRSERMTETCPANRGRRNGGGGIQPAAIRMETPCNAAEKTFSAWYDEYGTDILRYCFFFLGNRSDAEDAAQETFLKAWRSIDRFEARDGCSPKTWIIRIAGNTCRDYLRRGWYKHERQLITPEDLRKLGNAPDEDRELIMDIMNLPEKYRQVILLVFWYGMTIREAAECIRTSESTVFRRLEKAKKMIA